MAARKAAKPAATKAPARRTRKKAETVAEEPDYFDPGELLDQVQDATEKKYGLTNTSLTRSGERMSSGLLSLDVLLNGGIVGGGWYTIFGPEQSAKSTLAMTILASALDQRINKGSKFACGIFDYEGSVDEEYTNNIVKSMGIKGGDVNNIFGLRDVETGEWEIPPIARYYSHDVGEDFFNALGKVKRELPDKIEIGGKHYFLFEHTRENKKRFSGQYDAAYLTKHNKIKVPAKDGFMQALYLVDSYPAMLPDGLDDDQGKAGIGSQARMFSEGIKKVKGGMRKKAMTVIGINQLREKPMVMFGSPDYEPGGKALGFFSDVRIKSTPRGSVPYHFSNDKGMTIEKNVQGGKDTYRYIRLKTIKNKLGGIPQQECWARIWVSDGTGAARGYDPAMDTFEYFKLMGWVSGTKSNFKFHEDTPIGTNKVNPKVKFTWDVFKTLVVGTPAQIKEQCVALGIKPTRIRNWTAKHCASGKGPQRFKEIITGDAKDVAEPDDD